MSWDSAVRSSAWVVRMMLSSWQKGRLQRSMRLSMELSRITAFIKAVAVAMAFAVDGVFGMTAGDGAPGMIAGVWARQGMDGARRNKMMAIAKYRPGFIMLQM